MFFCLVRESLLLHLHPVYMLIYQATYPWFHVYMLSEGQIPRQILFLGHGPFHINHYKREEEFLSLYSLRNVGCHLIYVPSPLNLEMGAFCWHFSERRKFTIAF